MSNRWARTPSMSIPRVSKRTAALAVGGMVAAAAVAWQVAPSGAADSDPAPVPTQTISFTSDGPTPAALEIPSGTKVVFANDANSEFNSGLRPVSITISGATQQPFTVRPGDTATVGPYTAGADKWVVRYQTNYDSTFVGGLFPERRTVGGTLTVDPPTTGASTTTGAAKPVAPAR